MEASLNVHLQYYAKNVRNIQNDFTLGAEGVLPGRQIEFFESF